MKSRVMFFDQCQALTESLLILFIVVTVWVQENTTKFLKGTN